MPGGEKRKFKQIIEGHESELDGIKRFMINTDIPINDILSFLMIAQAKTDDIRFYSFIKKLDSKFVQGSGQKCQVLTALMHTRFKLLSNNQK